MVSTTSFNSSSMQNDVHFVKFCFHLNDERDDEAGYDFRASLPCEWLIACIDLIM